MSPTTEILFAVFTGLIALALLVQAVAVLAISRKVRDINARLDTLSAKLSKQADTLASQAADLMSAVKIVADKVHVVEENVAAVTEVVRHRVVEVDAFLNEATDAARLQMARLQDILETTAGRIDETINTLQDAIVVPVTEVHAIIRGIRCGLDVLFGRRRLPSHRSHNDEEMFS